MYLHSNVSPGYRDLLKLERRDNRTVKTSVLEFPGQRSNWAESLTDSFLQVQRSNEGSPLKKKNWLQYCNADIPHS